jgi:hypothetical protein
MAAGQANGQPVGTGSGGDPSPKLLWQNAKDTYFYDDYLFKGFESLHVLSILHYERELCRVSQKLVKDGNVGFADTEDGKAKLTNLRELLDGHSESSAFNDYSSGRLSPSLGLKRP